MLWDVVECLWFYVVSDLTRVFPIVLFFVYAVMGLSGKMFFSVVSCCSVVQCLCMLSRSRTPFGWYFVVSGKIGLWRESLSVVM